MRAEISTRLRAFERREIDAGGRRHSAVAVCLVYDDAHRLCLVITRRSSRLRSHKAQWALPGGRIDAGETAPEAALREMREEVDLVVPPDRVIGMLDDYATRSGYVITPIVVWAAEESHELIPNEAEVDSVHRVPLTDLDVEPTFVAIPESDAPVIRLPLFGRLVHAPTAAVVYQFCQVGLRGLDTRVAHLEQPVFAWK